MGILLSESWRQSRQAAGASQPHWSSAQASGVSRLLLALVVIAAIVAMLDRAADANAGARVASATVQKHQGAPK